MLTAVLKSTKLCFPTILAGSLSTNNHLFNYADTFLNNKCLENQAQVKAAFDEYIDDTSSEFYTT